MLRAPRATAALRCAAAAAVAAAGARAGSPVPSAMGVPLRRAFLDTEWGQLHYAVGRRVDPSRRTLVLYHSNPHSMIEFHEFLNDPLVRGRYNFVALDYFGCGGSDDCLPPACGAGPGEPHPCVSAEEMVTLTERILAEIGVASRVVCVGHLKGASIATECARRLGPRCDAVMAINPMYFLPSQVPHVIDYMNRTMHVRYEPDGSHLTDAWSQPSCAPCDRINYTAHKCRVWDPRTLEQNEWKTADRIRSLRSQWQYLLMGVRYNAGLVNETALADITARRYLGWGTKAIKIAAGIGYDGSEMVDAVNRAWGRASGNTTRIDLVDGASEGSMVQNASHYARELTRLLS